MANNSGSKFVTKGVAFSDDMIATNPAVKSMFEDYKRALGGDSLQAKNLTVRGIESGVEVPVVKQVGPTDTFVRMVPITNDGPGISSFYISKAQYDTFVAKGMNAAQISDVLGLPASSFANGGAMGFQSFAVQPKPGQLTTVYQSTIAPVEQGGYRASSGVTQYIVPELYKFSPPTPIPGGVFVPVPMSGGSATGLGSLVPTAVIPNNVKR